MEKYIQQSTSLFGSLKNAVLGNPVTREFTIGQQVASFGPGLLWKVFEGKKKTTGQDVSVFIFEKSLIDRYDKKDREYILEKMRQGPQQLTKLRHPRVLTVQNPLEESRDSLAFATEPVFGSLANIMGKHENFPNGLPASFKDFELYAVEKVYGLLQIVEGLSFLHNDANLVEGNLTADNIIITKGGQWKLAGFHFCMSKLDNAATSEYSTHLPPIGRQDLNYLAPEWVLSQHGQFSFDLCKSDMFSFGCLIGAVYNCLKTPFDAGDSIAAYKKCTEQMSRFGSDFLKNVPTDIRNHASLLLNVASETRPDASSTLSHPFFDDVAAMTLKYLDTLIQRDDVTKSHFFKNLHNVLDKLPLRVLHQRVLPPLFAEFPNHMMIPFVLTNVFLVAEQSKKEQYMSLIFPELKKIFHITKPIQVLLIFMQKMELMLKMTSPNEIKLFVLPLIFKALEAQSDQIQELVLTIIPDFVHMIDYSSLKNAIIPRLKVLVMKSKSLKVRVNALVCFGKIISKLDKFVLVDDVFPALRQVPCREPATLMAILGIYKQTLQEKKINLEKDYLATTAIPFLLPLAVEPTLNAQQFNNFMSVIREMFDRVEQEHRTKLEQLQKLQDEQRSSIDFVKAANKNVDADGMDSMMTKVDNLVVGKPSSNVKSIGANSEFAKMFGLSDETSKSTSLMGKSSSHSGNSKLTDTSSFDPVSSQHARSPTLGSSLSQTSRMVSNNSKPMNAKANMAASRLMANNLNQMSTPMMAGATTNTTGSYPSSSQIHQPKPDMSSFDSVLTPQMGSFKYRQQHATMNSMQQQINYAGSRSLQPSHYTHSSLGQHHSPNNALSQHHSPNNPYNTKQPMNNSMMQTQTQSITMFQSQTQMYNMPNMNNLQNDNSNFGVNPTMNSGVLQPTQSSNVLRPTNAGGTQAGFSNQDLNDLLL